MSDVGCRISTSRMSDFNKSDVGCRILTSRMSDFNKSDVGFLQIGCRMSDGTYKLPYSLANANKCSIILATANKI